MDGWCPGDVSVVKPPCSLAGSDAYGMTYSVTLRDWLVESNRSIHTLTDNSKFFYWFSQWFTLSLTTFENQLVVAAEEGIRFVNLLNKSNTLIWPHPLECDRLMSPYVLGSRLYCLTTGQLQSMDLKTREIRVDAGQTVLDDNSLLSGLMADPLDSTMFWMIKGHSLIAFDLLNKQIYHTGIDTANYCLTYSGHVLFPRHIGSSDSRIALMDRRHPFQTVDICEIDGPVRSLSVDRHKRQILLTIGFDLNPIAALRGLPKDWFQHPSLLHNTKRIAVLIAFLRANANHTFRYSVLAFLDPLVLSLIPSA